MEPILLVHGGAGDIPENRVPGKMNGVKHATRAGYEKLKTTGSVMDAVEEAVRQLEIDEYFNAGKNQINIFSIHPNSLNLTKSNYI